MKVTTFVANNNFDAVDEQIKLIGRGLQNNVEQFVIVPDRFSLSCEKLIMEKLNLTASFDFQVLSLSRLAGLVLGKKFDKKILSMLDAVMIVQFLIKKNKDRFVCFSSIPATTTFAQSLFDSISQIKSCKITPTMLKNATEKLEDGNLKQKMQDIALVYELYENYISENFVDSNNKIGLLCEKLKSSQIFEGKDVHFCNFQDFTAQDFDVVKNSIKCAKSVSLTVKLPNKNQPNADVFLRDTQTALKQIFDELNLRPEIVFCDSKQTNTNKHITNNLFCLNPEVQEIENNQVMLFSAENLEEEVVFVAKKILWLLGQGEQLSNIVLNVCDLKTYQGILQNIFNRYDIPFWIDQDVCLDSTEIAKLFNALFDVLKFGYQTDDVLRFVFNGLIFLDENEKQAFDFYSKKFGLVGFLWTKPLKLKNVDENLKLFEAKKLEIMGKIQNVEEEFKSCKTLADFCLVLKHFAQNFEIQQKCEDLSLKFENLGNLKQSSIFRQCFEKIEKILEQMVLVLGDEECCFDEFCDMFNVCLKSSQMVPLPMGTNNLLVGQMLSSMFEPKPYVFVLGATEENLPAFMKDVGIISDTDIALLQGININPTIEQINKKTIMTVLENFALATKQLCVTYPRNIRSSEHGPSQVFANLCKMFSAGGQCLDVVPINNFLQDKNFFKNFEERAKFLFPTKKDVLFWILSLPEQDFKNKQLKEFAEKIFQTNEFKNFENNDSKFVKNAKDLFFTKGFTSATEIETYFDCPFKHFVRYGLKLQEKQTSKVDPMNVGNILHEVVEKFAVFAADKILGDDEIETFASNIFKKICDSAEYERFLIDPQNQILMKGLLNESKRICKAINYQNSHSKYKIKFVEAVFGDKNFAPQLSIAVVNSNKKLKMSGKVDRVDFLGSKFRVVDYKTGKSKSSFEMLDLYLGKKIQIFVYMKAIFNGMKNVLPTGAFYYPLHNEYLKSAPAFPYENHCMKGVTIDDLQNFFDQDDNVNKDNPKSFIVDFSLKDGVLKDSVNLVSENQLLRMMDYSQKVMSLAISEIFEGYIEPKPLDNSCTYCKAKGFCPIKKFNQEAFRQTNFAVTKQTFEEVLKDEPKEA